MDHQLSYTPAEEKHFNKRVWIALAVFTLIVVAAAVLFLTLTPNPLAEKSNLTNGNTYTNTALHITCTVPDSWVAPDEETIRQAVESSAETMGTEADTESAHILMMYQDPITGGYVQFTCTYAPDITHEQMASAMNEYAASFAEAWTPGGSWSVSQPYATTMAGHEWQTSRVQLHDLSADVFFLTLKFDDYLCAVTAVGLTSENPAGYLDFFTATD